VCPGRCSIARHLVDRSIVKHLVDQSDLRDPKGEVYGVPM
jgi:hypothetical protein